MAGNWNFVRAAAAGEAWNSARGEERDPKEEGARGEHSRLTLAGSKRRRGEDVRRTPWVA